MTKTIIKLEIAKFQENVEIGHCKNQNIAIFLLISRNFGLFGD